jgi:hypothetical protein
VAPDRTTGLLHQGSLWRFLCYIRLASTVLPGPVHAALGRDKKMRMFIRWLFSIGAVAAFLLPLLSQEAVGSVCIDSIPADARLLDSDTGAGVPMRAFKYQFSIQIDDGELISVPVGSGSVLVSGLSIAKKHHVIIRDAGTPIESFSFTFQSRGGSNLCLSYGVVYQTWSLEPKPKHAKWCTCVIP